MNNKYNEAIIYAKSTECNNIIEFINKAPWMYCRSGYTIVEGNLFKKICLHINNCENNDCRLYNKFELDNTDYLYRINYILKNIPRNYCYILTIGIEL